LKEGALSTAERKKTPVQLVLIFLLAAHKAAAKVQTTRAMMSA
jgi:hypothetical protein